MGSPKITILLCLLALCLSFVAAAPTSTSVKSTTSKKISIPTKTSSISIKNSLILTKKSSTSTEKSSSSTKKASISIKTTVQTKLTSTPSPTNVLSKIAKTTLVTKASSTSSSSNSLPSSTLKPFTLSSLYYTESASSLRQYLGFHIVDPQTSNQTDCSIGWAGYYSSPPSNWTSCDDSTFSFRVTAFDNTHTLGWSYELKHQYRRHGIACLSSTGPECVTTLGHAVVTIEGDSGDSSAPGEGFVCGGSGNCGGWKNEDVPGYIDSSCKGVACKSLA